jgi:hypothetical protein
MFTVISCCLFQIFTVYYHKYNVDHLAIRKHVKWKFIGKSGSDRLNFVACVYRPPRSRKSEIFRLPCKLARITSIITNTAQI